MFLLDPPPTNADIHFRVLGIPVRIHPMFWLGAALLNMSARSARELLAWIAAVFIGVLVHELGHAAVMRWFGFMPRITLYTFGGMAQRGAATGRREPGWIGQIFIAAAGPAAGFLLALLVTLLGVLAGGEVYIVRFMNWIYFPFVNIEGGPLAIRLLAGYLQLVCFFWGLINLLPVLPLDGGHIAQHILVRISPYDGLHRALVLSLVTAAGMAVFSLLRLQDWFLALFFGYLAFGSFNALQSHGMQRPW